MRSYKCAILASLIIVVSALVPVERAFAQGSLPSGWSDRDIGQVGVAGSATYGNGTFTVKGAGSQIWGSADSFHFVYQPLSGDGTIVARVVSAGSGLAASVMIRETLDAGSANAIAGYYVPSGVYYMNYRATAGGATSGNGTVTATLPYWVELVRSGNTFSGYASPDGVNWVQIGTTQTINMAQNVYIGLVAGSYTSTLATATFDNVSVSSTANPAPVITSLSATTGSIGSQVVISGSGFGASQGAGAVLLNDAPVTVNSWSATSITITIPSGASSGPLGVSVAPSMNDSNAIDFTVTTQPLPSTWLDRDVGPVAIPGSSAFSNGTFTVQGSGADIWGSGDQFHFVYQPLGGDGTIVARVVTRQGTGTVKAGVMIRETLNSASTEMDTTQYGTTQIQLLYRLTTGGGTSYASSGDSVPYWVKVVRSGNNFSGYMSADGLNWVQVGSTQAITMAQNVYIGLAVSDVNNSALATATFDNVSVAGPGAYPIISALSPNSGGVGASITITGTNFGATQGASGVTFNGTAAAPTSWSPTSIVVPVPSGASTGNVVVTVSGLSSNAMNFTVLPVISSLTPPGAPVGGTITVAGSGFGAAVGQVQFNAISGSLNSWTDTSISVSVPSNATSGSVTVVKSGLTSNAAAFTLLQPLSVTTLSPSVGAVGSSITIGGTGFGSTQSNSTVAFYGGTATVTSWTDTQIVAVVPAGAASGPVSVTVAGISSQGPTFTLDGTAQLTDSLGNSTSYTSLEAGGKWYVSDAQGSGCSSCTVRGTIHYTYDSLGNILTETDELGRTKTYTYDSANNLTSESIQVDANNTATTSYTYNGFGEVLMTTDALGNTTTNTYDSKGNLLSVTTPAPNSSTAASVTNFAYDAKGELTQITDPLNHITTLSYTTAGQIATITDAQQNVTSYQYDARGNRTAVVDPVNGSAHPTTFTYDIMNRLTQITYPDNSFVSFGYDTRGRRTSVTDQNGKNTTYGYDDADRLVTVTDAAQHTTHYAYDTENNLSSITDANNNVTSFTYDAFGRVTQTAFPSSYAEAYGYDAVGNLTSKTDRNGHTIQYVYDALNRLTQKSYPDSTNVEYVYDLVGKIKQVTDPTGTYGFSYDNMGRLIGTTTQYSFLPGSTFTNSYTYDAASNRLSLTAPDGSITTYGYDSVNRVNDIANSWAGSFGFGYDALSRRTSLTRPNGMNTSYTYDSVSHLLSVLHQAGGTTLDGASYTYDAAGNRTSKTNYLNGITDNYAYDALYQLQQVTEGTSTTESYTYDPVGNRLSSLTVPHYSYNTANELTSTSLASYTYDHNGNTLTKADSNGTTQYSWDFENRLTSITVPNAGTTSFRYDPFGRRILKSGPLGTTTFLYDVLNVIEEVDNGGNVLADYTHGSVVDETLSMLRGGTTSYDFADGLGSITSLSTVTGALANTYTYDSFGKATASTGTVTNPLQFSGREFDQQTGLYFNRARYYDPNAGRFISEDPIAFEGGINFYEYAYNSPTNLRDPSGRSAAATWPLAEGLGGVICVGSGVCETVVVVGGVVVGVAATGYLVYNWYESRDRGHADPIPYPGTRNPGQCDKEPGKCNPCPPDSPYWDQPGNAHGGTAGVHYHWYHWNQKPYPDCTCYPSRISGGTPPTGGTPWTPGGAPWP